MMTKAVATIIQATSPLLGTGVAAAAAEAVAAGAAAVVTAADAAGAAASAGLASVEADAAGTAAGVWANATVPPARRVKPKVREISSFFIGPPRRFHRYEYG